MKNSVMTINKSIITQTVSREFGLDPKKAAECVNEIINIAREAVHKDNYLLISGFGRFNKRNKKARKGRNPATGKTITLEERNVITFHPSAKLLKALKAASD